MRKVHNLQDLASRSQKDLETILGNDTNAKLLWESLHTTSSSNTASSSSTTDTKRGTGKGKRKTSTGKTKSK